MTICDLEAIGIGLGILTVSLTYFHYFGEAVNYWLDDNIFPSIFAGFISTLVLVTVLIFLAMAGIALFQLGHYILGC